MNIVEYKGVWIFAEQREGVLQKVSLELLGKGREIADELGVELTAILLGNDIKPLADELIVYGADSVLVADSPLLENFTTDGYTKVICELINERKPEILFLGASFIGRDLGPRIAARVGTGLTADCTELEIDGETKDLLMTRPAFGGNLMATIVCQDHRPQMSTVRPGVFDKSEKDENRTGKIEVVKVELEEIDIRTKVEEIVKQVKGVMDISEANVIVAGGRGVGSKENFDLLKEVADELGGTIAASRAVIDNGWLEKDYQVGQTGKTVRPSLYIACGISGAIQHLAGMQDSDYIIAINKDDEAPIMKAADLSIVGDLNKILPEIAVSIRCKKDL